MMTYVVASGRDLFREVRNVVFPDPAMPTTRCTVGLLCNVSILGRVDTVVGTAGEGLGGIAKEDIGTQVRTRAALG